MKPLAPRSRGAHVVSALIAALLAGGCTAGRGHLGVTGIPSVVTPAATASKAPSAGALANLGGFEGLLSGPSALVANNSGSLIANNGGGLIANNGGGLVSNGSGNLVSNAAGSYRVAEADALVPVSGATVTVTDAEGRALSAPATSDASGRFRITAVQASGALVFLRARYRLGDQDVTLVLAVAAPRAKGFASAGLDPATTLVGKAIAERLRHGGSADATEADAVAKLLRSVMSPVAVARACVETDAEADGTFDAMLAESPALAGAVQKAAPSGGLAPSPGSTPAPSPSPSPVHHSGGGGSGPAPTPTPTPTGSGAITVTAFDRPSATAGEHIVLTGTGFSAVPAENVVTMGATPVTVAASTTTTIEIIVPSAASGPVKVTVGTDFGTSTADLEIVATGGGFVAGLDASGFVVTATDLWVLNEGNDNASVTSLQGAASTTYGIDHLPVEIAKDANGDFFVACQEAGVIKVKPSGAVAGRFDAAATSATDDVHGLAVSPLDQSVWAVNFDYDNVAKLANDGTFVDTFPVGDMPRGVAVGADGDVWVANSDGLVTHLGSDGANKGTINVGNVPSGIAVAPDGHVWVTLVDVGLVVELDATGAILGQVDVGEVTHSLAFDANGAVWVPNGSANTVTRLGTDRSVEGVYPLAGTPTYVSRGVDGRMWVIGTGDQKATSFTP